MKYKIGIFGSAVNEHSEARAKAKELGKELSKKNIIIITGGCTGMPYIVANEAAKNGTEVWGFAPNIDKKTQLVMYPHDDITIYKQLHYIPKNYRELFFITEKQIFNDTPARKKYRNVISTANCDAGIIISGRWGTLNEFTNLMDMGKVIGVLTGTGGVADEIEKLMNKVNKPSKAKVFFNDSPKKLVSEILTELETRKTL